MSDERPLPPALARRPTLTDGGSVALAVAASLGAWFHLGPPGPAVVAVVVVAAIARHPAALIVAALVVASALGARAHQGLRPVDRAPYAGPVTLVADPQRSPYGAHVDVRVGHRRVELVASGAAAGAVERSLAGERLWVQGALAPPRPRSPWLVPRHVVGRLTARRAERLDAGAAPWRGANRIRRLLEHGVQGFGSEDRALFMGFVLGDDRDQPPEVVDDFRGAGLSHLLVVSGQNVAFVLAVAGPALRRLAWGPRWAVTLGIIAAFATLARFEPSVLRASAMAALAVTASARGRPAGSVRVLALAVTALVLIDPLLVRSVGFQLSVGASLGIALLARPLAGSLPGPRWLAEALGVTLAAQVGVAPVLVPRFGGLPVVGLVTNLLAVPAAGLITGWGMSAGLLAGAVGGVPAQVLHLPTRALVAWVAAVARVGASIPSGELHAQHVAALVVAGAMWWGCWRHVARGAALAVAAVALASPAVALRHHPASQRVAGGAVVRWQGPATVVEVPGAAPTPALLEGLRRAGVRRIDVLVVDGGDPQAIVRTLTHRWEVRRVIARPRAP